MQIGSVGFSYQPYVYNTNTVSANSLNKISGIEEDALKSSVDYSSEKNENPLRPGETSNFADVLAMQFQLGRNNAARVMKPSDDAQNVAQVGADVWEGADRLEETSVTLTQALPEETAEPTISLGQTGTEGQTGSGAGNSNASLFLMNRAIEAYTAALAG